MRSCVVFYEDVDILNYPILSTFRLLQNHDGFQSRTDSCGLCRLCNCVMSANWWQGTTHRGWVSATFCANIWFGWKYSHTYHHGVVALSEHSSTNKRFVFRMQFQKEAELSKNVCWLRLLLKLSLAYLLTTSTPIKYSESSCISLYLLLWLLTNSAINFTTYSIRHLLCIKLHAFQWSFDSQ